MNTAAAVLFAVAEELAQKAKADLPKLQEDEKIKREWFADGTYYRETNHQIFRYDFRQKTVVA